MRLHLGIILFCLPFLLLSQQTENEIIDAYNKYKYNNPEEYSYFITDKNIYYSGDYVTFNLAVLNQYLSTTYLSEIAYIEFIHENNEYRYSYPVRLSNGVSSGGIVLPMDIPTGNYQLVAYTHFMRNFDLDDVSMRQSIYIQNTSTSSSEVAKSINWNKSDELPLKNSVEINVNETKSQILFEIDTKETSAKEGYLVSEGLGLIQFVAKVKLNKKKTNVSINKSQLKGSFQKIILLDAQLNVLGARGFYVKYPNVIESDSSSKSTINIDQIVSVTDILEKDSISLFRRFYQIYYQIPKHIDLSTRSFDEMTSSTFLNNHSDFVLSEWKEILSSYELSTSYEYKPEKNLHIRRKIEGDLSKLEGGYMSLHLFNSNLDFVKKIYLDELLTWEVGWPISDDFFFLSLYDSYENIVSYEYEIKPFEKPKISYREIATYYDKKLTDSIILKDKEFHYVLSTFNKEQRAKKYFWEGTEFNQIAKEEDFRGLNDFEEFIREAVLEVSVTSKEGQKSLSVYNPTNGVFEFPQMLILNDKVLNSAAPLFDIPLDQLVSVNVISNADVLIKLGSAFTGGIVVVLTKKPIDIPHEYMNGYFNSINGFLFDHTENEVSKRFNSTSLFEIVGKSSNQEINHGKHGSILNEIWREQILENGLYRWNRTSE